MKNQKLCLMFLIMTLIISCAYHSPMRSVLTENRPSLTPEPSGFSLTYDCGYEILPLSVQLLL